MKVYSNLLSFCIVNLIVITNELKSILSVLSCLGVGTSILLISYDSNILQEIGNLFSCVAMSLLAILQLIFGQTKSKIALRIRW